MKQCTKCGYIAKDSDLVCPCCEEKLVKQASAPKKEEKSAEPARPSRQSIAVKYADQLDNDVLYKLAIAKEVVPSTAAEAEEIYRILAFRGYPDGMYKYALMILKHTPPETYVANNWLRIAAGAGHKPSSIYLAAESWKSTEQQAVECGTNRAIPGSELFGGANANLLIPGGGSFAERVRAVLPSTVTISVLKTQGKRCAVSRGAGFIAADGLVITNAHVIGDDPDCISARFEPSLDKTEHALIPLGIFPQYDVAVLRFAGYDARAKALALRTTAVGYAEEVFTIGNPLGIGMSVSRGVVSSPARATDYPSEVKTVIQTDITANRGNSGGALFDEQNAVIGMLTFSPDQSEGGISMCVPAEYIVKAIQKTTGQGGIY